MMASSIADKLGYEFVGDDLEITGISYSDEASETEIAVAFNRDEMNKTRAKVILTARVLLQTEKTLILTHENIDYSMVRVCDILINNGLLVDYSRPVKYTLCKEGYYIGTGCRIGEGALIQPGAMIGNDVFIGNGCVIDPYVVIGSGTIICDNVHIKTGSKIGAESFYHYYDSDEVMRCFQGCGRTVLREGVYVGSNTVIERGTLSDTIIDANCMIGHHIGIGHDVKIGRNCKIVSQTGIAGRAILKNNVLVYGQVGISNHVVVGNNVVIKGKTTVSKSVKDNTVIYGLFGRDYADEMRLIAGIRSSFGRKKR